LAKRGFIIAGNQIYYKKLKHIKGLKWISYNWDLIGPCNVSGDVVAYGHTSSWTSNYFDEEKFNLVLDVLSKKQFDFKFISEMI